MRCIQCGATDTRVIDSRDAGNAVRRRRQCVECNTRFTTYERTDTGKPLVVKQSGRRESWSRTKLLEGVRLACAKRPVTSTQIEDLADEVESQFSATARSEVSSRDVGQAVMRRLRLLDDVAYIRFASVYRRFRDANGFVEEVENVRRRPQPPDEQMSLDI